ncbi:hypothetical protein MJO29_010689 [Puccinia striiformis f. sp. tritici]|nr:hypothetical protein MJO29_010689 [Puccinia striiformis f. sp. tritici]
MLDTPLSGAHSKRPLETDSKNSERDIDGVTHQIPLPTKDKVKRLKKKPNEPAAPSDPIKQVIGPRQSSISQVHINTKLRQTRYNLRARPRQHFSESAVPAGNQTTDQVPNQHPPGTDPPAIAASTSADRYEASCDSSYRTASVRFDSPAPSSNLSQVDNTSCSNSALLSDRLQTPNANPDNPHPPSDTSTEKGSQCKSRIQGQVGTDSNKKGKSINFKGKSTDKTSQAISKEDRRLLAAKRKAKFVEKRREAAELKQRIIEEKKRQQALWPKISEEELEALQLAIQNIEVPTSITRVPKLIGIAGNRTLKAAEWHVLLCVYFPLVLVPLWFFGTKNPNQQVLLESMASLIGITNILSARSISNRDGSNVQDLLMSYRKLLSDHWVASETKPNLHISQHFPQVISRFGPPASMAAWAQERLNGILGKIPTNTHLSDMNTTILSKWNMKSQLLSLLRDHSGLFDKLPMDLMKVFLKQQSDVKGSQKNLSANYLSKLAQHILDSDHLDMKNSSLNPSPAVTFFPSTTLDKRKYSILSKHEGNATICFAHENHLAFGQIQEIFASKQFDDRMFFVVSPFKRLDSLPLERDPYRSYPNLNSALLSLTIEENIVIDDTLLQGHAVILKNKPGTFRIDTATCCAVALTLEISTVGDTDQMVE